MRGAVWAVLLLLLPVTSGLTITPPTENHLPRNGEHLLVLEEGVWTSAKWKVLEDVGIHPLRSINADALLVWTEDDRDSWPLDVEVAASQSAHFRLGLDTPAGPSDYRVLLESNFIRDNNKLENQESNGDDDIQNQMCLPASTRIANFYIQ